MGSSGLGKQIARGDEYTDQWIVRPNGTIIARVEHLDRSNQYRILAPADKARGRDWETIFSEETERPNMTVYGVDQTGESLIIGTRMNTDRYALFEMSVADGTISPTALFEHEFVDVSSPIVDDYTGEVIGAEIIYAAREQQFFQGQFVAAVKAEKKCAARRVSGLP